MLLFTPPVVIPLRAPYFEQRSIALLPNVLSVAPIATSSVPEVPFYSQFKDITSAKWKKVGCGIASLAMMIEYYKPDTVSVNTLLLQGINAGAYKNDAGWTYKGLIGLSKRYGLNGISLDLGKSSTASAFLKLETYLKEGPVIASVHYKFEPTNPIPHLVVIDGIKDGMVYYNDPASTGGGKKITTEHFLGAWKKRFIVIRPPEESAPVSVTLRPA